MKNYLLVALILCAIPAVAFGQKVSCDDCTHVASVYMGEGGVIATADDADMVTWVASCGGVTRSGELEPNDDGVVAALWTGDLACMAEGGGSFEIGPVMDGGWFWVTDADNSAVGGLVSMDVLENDAADITSAGDGVSMTMGKGAVYLKEAASGRVGILPNILPEPPAKEMDRCGYNDAGRGKTPRYTVKNSGCSLGDGGTMIRAQGAVDPYTGKPTAGTMVRRPLTATNTTVVTVDLWGNGTGHFNPNGTADGDATATPNADPRLGHAEIVLALTDDGANADPVTGGGFAATIGGVGTTPIGSTPPTFGTGATSVAGGATFAVKGNVGTLTIYADGRYCNPTATPPVNVSETFTISAFVTASQEGQVTPTIKTAGNAANRLAAQTKITVVCPSGSAAAHQGQELVPENPFPISE